VAPAAAGELAQIIRSAAAESLTVKPVGTGRSFTAVAATAGILVRPERLAGIRTIDRAADTVTVGAGTPLRQLNQAPASGSAHWA
jgi:FAD/FMN-containing dehydrogenase